MEKQRERREEGEGEKTDQERETERRRRRKMDFVREKGSGHYGPCHLVSSILSLKIPVLSSGRFCGGYCKGLESDKTEQYGNRICDFESKFPFLTSSTLSVARAPF